MKKVNLRIGFLVLIAGLAGTVLAQPQPDRPSDQPPRDEAAPRRRDQRPGDDGPPPPGKARPKGDGGDKRGPFYEGGVYAPRPAGVPAGGVPGMPTSGEYGRGFGGGIMPGPSFMRGGAMPGMPVPFGEGS